MELLIKAIRFLTISAGGKHAKSILTVRILYLRRVLSSILGLEEFNQSQKQSLLILPLTNAQFPVSIVIIYIVVRIFSLSCIRYRTPLARSSYLCRLHFILPNVSFISSRHYECWSKKHFLIIVRKSNANLIFIQNGYLMAQEIDSCIFFCHDTRCYIFTFSRIRFI